MLNLFLFNYAHKPIDNCGEVSDIIKTKTGNFLKGVPTAVLSYHQQGPGGTAVPPAAEILSIF